MCSRAHAPVLAPVTIAVFPVQLDRTRVVPASPLLCAHHEHEHKRARRPKEGARGVSTTRPGLRAEESARLYPEGGKACCGAGPRSSV
uniref:Secreted protein n=1 Tax=Knipowitschia caucasica TaxID=637954 RepID=A0AAV2MV63_KNICA